MGFFWWPFGALGMFIGLVLGLVALAFWVWMIVDCAQRKFRNDAEKIIWIIVMIVTGWIGALVYFIAIRNMNHRGISKS